MEDQMKISNYNRLLIVFILLFLLSGCATTTWQENKKAIIGGLGGAAAGGLIASAFNANTAGIVGGALLGGLIGGAVGNRMDSADRRKAYHATQYSLEKNPLGVGKSKAKEFSMPQKLYLVRAESCDRDSRQQHE